MPEPSAYDAAFVDRVVELGRSGYSRAEIAVELGCDAETLAGWSGEHPDFAAALRRADAEARAWWDRKPREAVMKGGVFHPAVWSKAMSQRFGRVSHRPPRDEQAEAGSRKLTREEIAARELADFDIPDNGRGRRPGRRR